MKHLFFAPAHQNLPNSLQLFECDFVNCAGVKLYYFELERPLRITIDNPS